MKFSSVSSASICCAGPSLLLSLLSLLSACGGGDDTNPNGGNLPTTPATAACAGDQKFFFDGVAKKSPYALTSDGDVPGVFVKGKSYVLTVAAINCAVGVTVEGGQQVRLLGANALDGVRGGNAQAPGLEEAHLFPGVGEAAQKGELVVSAVFANSAYSTVQVSIFGLGGAAVLK